MVDRQKIKEAIDYLIASPNYARLINEMTKIIDQWDTHPMTYGGQLTLLNALLDVGLTNRDAFERIVKLIEEKRKLVPALKRQDYQRNLMRDRRARVAKAIELAERTAPKMTAAQRKAYEKDLIARWNEAKDKFIAEKPDQSWKGRHAATAEFWEMIDTQLDQNLRARKK